MSPESEQIPKTIELSDILPVVGGREYAASVSYAHFRVEDSPPTHTLFRNLTQPEVRVSAESHSILYLHQ